MKKLLTVMLLAGMGSAANAGITIHYEGTASSSGAVARILSTASAFAKRHGWKIEKASAQSGILKRQASGGKNMDYTGAITGIVIHPNAKCEPLFLQFGDDLIMENFVKTQYAGADTHVAVVQLFEKIKPYFTDLQITDEGEYWDRKDRAFLERNMAKINELVEEEKRKKPTARGPVFLPSGRIVDVVVE